MRARAELYRTRVVPLRNRALQETMLQSNAMAISVFTLLLAKQAQIDAGVGYVAALRDYWMSRVELERVVGTVLPTRPMVDAPIDRDIFGTDTMSVDGARTPRDSVHDATKTRGDPTVPMTHPIPTPSAPATRPRTPAVGGMSGMPMTTPAKPPTSRTVSPSQPIAPHAAPAAPVGSKKRGRTPATDSASTRVPRP